MYESKIIRHVNEDKKVNLLNPITFLKYRNTGCICPGKQKHFQKAAWEKKHPTILPDKAPPRFLRRDKGSFSHANAGQKIGVSKFTAKLFGTFWLHFGHILGTFLPPPSL